MRFSHKIAPSSLNLLARTKPARNRQPKSIFRIVYRSALGGCYKIVINIRSILPHHNSKHSQNYLSRSRRTANVRQFFAEDPHVFVAGDLLWYPVECDNTIRTAPDVMVIFDRPKGDRGSYQQWEENNIPPQVVIDGGKGLKTKCTLPRSNGISPKRELINWQLNCVNWASIPTQCCSTSHLAKPTVTLLIIQ
jgi:hypothetical protein